MLVMRYQRAMLSVVLISCFFPSILARGSEVALGESGGIYTVPVQVNRSVTLPFLVDPGAGVVVIPQSLLKRLVLNGTVTEGDLIGIGIAELADSSLYKAVQLRLRELRVGDAVARDVVAAVSPGLSQPLLGQSFLKRFASVTFDNQRHVLVLTNSGVGASMQYPANVPTAPYYSSVPPTPPPTTYYYSQPSYWPPAR
jgi:clan AA aspartic protease (TIGR02281 family)